MLKRTITGAIYVAIIVGFFFLRDVDYRLFDILTFFFCALGTFEVARAVKEYLYKGNFTLACVFGVIFVPVFCVFENYTAFCGAYACLILSAAAVFLQVIYAAVKAKEGNGRVLRAFGVNALPFLYPPLLLLFLLLANATVHGFICLLLIFVISPCADTFAYLVGEKWEVLGEEVI